VQRAAKKDSNQDEIVFILKAHGAKIINTTQLKNAFDLLVLFEGNIFIVEVKQPKGKMSEGELKCKALVESAGCKYHVIRTPDEALEMIGKL
jgi:hypothetical protein